MLHRELGRARHPPAAHAEALQDRREARHDRQHRGRRQGRGARARAPGAPRAHGRARALRRSRSRAIRIVQEDLPLVERPVRRVRRADRLRRGRRCWSCSRSFKERKLMRRFAAVMNHRTAGFKANAMGVWAVPDDRARRGRPADGRVRAREPLLPAPTYDDWPYSIFTMVHGKNAKECEATIAAIRDETGDRRVRAPVVGEGVQEDPRALLHRRLGRLATPSTCPPDGRGGRPLSTSIDVARVRADTPGCRDVVHLNNAGAALPPRVVVDTVIEHLELEARIGGYAAADAVADRSSAVYDSVAVARRRAPRRDRARGERDPRRGTWRSTRWRRRSRPATASSRRAPSTRAT